MRLFIAIPLPSQIQNYISVLQNNLKQYQKKIIYVQNKNTHITLKFLGETPNNKISDILNSIKTIAESNTSFNAKISTVDSFPNSFNPKILWLGLDKISEEKIKKIAVGLDNLLESHGFQKETRDFTSHITFARVKDNINNSILANELVKIKKNIELTDFKKFNIDKITLFQSRLTNAGAIYEVIGETNLKTI